MAKQQQAEVPPGEVRLSPDLEAAVKASVAMSVAGVKEATETFHDEDGGGNLKRFQGHIPAPMQPAAGTRELSIGAAGALARFQQAERASLNKKGPVDWKGIISYVECTDSACQGPGIWIFGDPRLELSESNWASTYHPIGSYWPPRDAPHCQCCFEVHGVRRKLRIDGIGVGNPNNVQIIGFVANQRFVRTPPVDLLQKSMSPEEFAYLKKLAS